MMKLNFQQEALVLPGAVLSHTDAGEVALRVLLWLASDLSLAEKPRQLAKLCGCDIKEVRAAMDTWLAAGILVGEGESAVPVMATPATAAAPAPAPQKKTLKRAEELPNYSSDQLASLLETRATLRALVDEAQRTLGKIFNVAEVNILVGMFDYLGMSEEGILLLLAHCTRIGKTGMRSIERYACSLVDRDIVTVEQLEEEIRTVEAMKSFEGQVRTLFGMKSRALTSREEKMLRAWVSYGYDLEIVRRAYELTVQATGDASVPYANTILERWNSEGLRTAEEIDASIAEQEGRRQGQKRTGGKSRPVEPSLGNSFDTDEFFEAALKRSLRETGAEADVANETP